MSLPAEDLHDPEVEADGADHAGVVDLDQVTLSLPVTISTRARSPT